MAYPFKILHALDTGLRQQIVAMGDYLWTNNPAVSYFKTIVMNSSPTQGIQIGSQTGGYSYGWRDIIGVPQEPVAGSGKPSWTQIASSGVYTWNYATNDLQYYSYHLPHDYVPGTDIYFHTHWFSSTTAGGSARWQYDFIYAQGHQQGPFPTTATTVYSQQVQETTAYTHMISETDAVTIASLETDGLILLKVTRIAPTGGPSDVSGGVFVPVIDIHYQSHNLATRNKAPNFYTGTSLAVLDSDGNSFTVSLEVYSANGTLYTVSTLVLNSSGVDFDCI